MKIETKFDVNNLVVSKYQRNPTNTKGKRESNFTDFNIAAYQNREYSQIREDELVEAPQDVIDLLLGVVK